MNRVARRSVPTLPRAAESGVPACRGEPVAFPVDLTRVSRRILAGTGMKEGAVDAVS
jgi:hypothetical protein